MHVYARMSTIETVRTAMQVWFVRDIMLDLFFKNNFCYYGCITVYVECVYHCIAIYVEMSCVVFICILVVKTYSFFQLLCIDLHDFQELN